MERESGFLVDARAMKRILQDTLDALEKMEQSGKIEIDIYMRAAEELQVLTGMKFQTAKKLIERQRADVKKIVLAK